MVEPSRLARALDDVRLDILDCQAGAATAVDHQVPADLCSARSAVAAAGEAHERAERSSGAAEREAAVAWADAEKARLAADFRAGSVARTTAYAHESLRWWRGRTPALAEALQFAGEACRLADRAAEAVAEAEGDRRRARSAAEGAQVAANGAAEARSSGAEAMGQATRRLDEALRHADAVRLAGVTASTAADLASALAGAGVQALADKVEALRRFDDPTELRASR